jgi:hypothetical protein
MRTGGPRRAIVALGSMGLASAVGLALSLASCTEISTDPNEIAAIEFDSTSLGSPSVVLGDTLRDTLGVVTPLLAKAFNAKGGFIGDAQIEFFTPDTTITITSAETVVGRLASTTPAKVIALAGGLQTLPVSIGLVLAPDTLRAIDQPEPLTLTSDSLRFSDSLLVALPHRDGTTTTGVGPWLVSFAVEYHGLALDPSDKTRAWITSATARNAAPTPIDTTDATAGQAFRLLAVRTSAFSGLATGQQDSVIVRASAKYRGNPVPGSPVRLVVYLRRQ